MKIGLRIATHLFCARQYPDFTRAPGHTVVASVRSWLMRYREYRETLSDSDAVQDIFLIPAK